MLFSPAKSKKKLHWYCVQSGTSWEFTAWRIFSIKKAFHCELFLPDCLWLFGRQLEKQESHSGCDPDGATGLLACPWIVHIMSQAEWKFQKKFIRETLLLSPEVQKDFPWFLNSSESSLGVAGSNSIPRFGQQFVSKGLYRCNLFCTTSSCRIKNDNLNIFLFMQ